MIRFRFAPIALAILALAGCNKSDDSSAPKAGAKIAAVAAPAGTSWADKIVKTDEGVRMGNPEAPIKLVEYGSYTCPHCRDFQAESHETMVKDYVNSGKVSFEYRNLIRDPIDLSVALVAHCAPPEAYFELTTQLFANQNDMITAFTSHSQAEQQALSQLPPDQRLVKAAEMANLIEFAKQRGLPEDKVRACLADTRKAQSLADQSESVLKKYPDFPGTPSFILNGNLLENTAAWPIACCSAWLCEVNWVIMSF